MFLYTVVKFVIFKPTSLPQPEKENVRISPVHNPKEPIANGEELPENGILNTEESKKEQ